MTSLGRLSVALVLAIAAGVGNYAWMWWVQGQHKTFVKAEKEIKIGQLIVEDDLSEVRVPGDPAELGKTFILADEGISLLVGMRAARDYRPGDLFLHEHIRMDLPRWKALGSFRLLSVGERVRSGGGYSEGRGSNNVTIAAAVGDDGKYDAKTERLLDIISSSATRDQASGMKVVAIQLDPVPGGGPQKPAEPEEDGAHAGDPDGPERPLLGAKERGIIVPLRDVESIPEVLVRGDYISFIVAWFDDSLDDQKSPAKIGD
jgi:hypothetical protein